MTNKPAATLRDGTIKATIWANASERGTFYSVDFVQGYKDQDGQWQDGTSFAGADVLKVANLATAAYNKILELKADAKEA